MGHRFTRMGKGIRMKPLSSNTVLRVIGFLVLPFSILFFMIANALR